MSSAERVAGRRRTPSTDIERELVGAAEEVLVRDGPGGVTVRAVAAQAGIAPMGVYNRLGGKDGLVDALLIRGFDMLCAAVTGRGEPDPLGRLWASGVRYREFALANRHFYAIMFEAAIPHESGSEAVAEHAAAAFGALVQHVDVAAAAGRIHVGDTREAAQQIWSTVHGAVALELKGLTLTPDPAATYRATLEMILRGLGAGDLAAGELAGGDLAGGELAVGDLAGGDLAGGEEARGWRG
jgi:AcrR family transcriptional regulator